MASAPGSSAAESHGRRPSRTAAVVVGALVVTIAARPLACFIPSNWLWGVDSFSHWGPYGAAMLAATAALGFIPAIGTRVAVTLTSLGAAWERSGARGDVLVGGAIAALLFTLRDDLRLTGDFVIRVGLLDTSAALAESLMGAAYPLDRLLHLHLPRLLVANGMSPPTALQLVGSLVGGLFALVGCRFLRAARARGIAAPLAALALFGGAVLVHFAGYDKFGPLLLGLAVCGKGALDAAHGRGLAWLASGTTICVLSHRSGYVVLPGVAWVFLRAWGTTTGSRRPRVLAASLVALVSSGLMLPHTLDLLLRVDRRAHLPGGAEAVSRQALGAPDPLLRLSDVLNVASWLVPLWLVGVAAAWSVWSRRVRAERRGSARGNAATSRGASPPGTRGGRAFSLAPGVALVLVGFVALVASIQPGGGWPRDWDIATGMGAVTALGVAYALVAARPLLEEARIAAPIATVGLAISVALWGVHTSETIGMRRIQTILGARPHLSDATRAQALDYLGARALNRGEPDRAANYFERSIALAPNPRVFYQAGLAYLAGGHLEQARRAFAEAAARNRGVPDPWVGLAHVSLAQRDTTAALAYLDSALARNPTLVDASALRLALRSSARGSRP